MGGLTLREPKSSYTMTLSEVPESRQSALNDREVQQHPESDNECTQRAGISIPEESTYAHSIRRMISPPREFTTKAQSQTTRTFQAKSEKVKRCWKVNTKLVETRSKSKHKTGQWPKRVKKQGQSMWKNKTKARAKMTQRQVKKLDEASRPRPAQRQAKSKTSEVLRQRQPKAVSVNKETSWRGSRKVYQSSSVYRTTTAINILFESKSSMGQRTSKEGMTMSKNTSYWQAKSPPGGSLPRHTLRSRPRSLLRSRPVKSYHEAKNPLGWNLLWRTEKSTSKVYHVDQHFTEAAYPKRNQKLTVKSTKSIKILLKPPFES